MLILRFVNVGNSRISARDSIVILTLIAWAAIVTSALMVSYDLQIKTLHSRLTFLFMNKLSIEPIEGNCTLVYDEIHCPDNCITSFHGFICTESADKGRL